MRQKSTQRGSGTLGCIVWTVLLVVGVLVAYKAIPVKIKSAELYDHMVEMGKYGGKTEPEEMVKDIVATAQRLELPLEKENVKVERNGDRLRMRATYTVPLEFPGYTYNWKFDHQVDVPIFIF
ncbi:MAG TPA: hypothetical protein VMM92_04725 [Thermoanaerobaculia bacterium]|nr:hypothetical protein [Thermoanaerobaculia bacterium]